MKMSNVKLAIRIRPFIETEMKSDNDNVSVVTVEEEHIVSIMNMKVSASGAGDSRERVRRYLVDYAFDSSIPHSRPEYASQEMVFNTIGRGVMDSLARGVSACILTYGQSATGKTFTMFGTQEEPGLVPRLCRALVDESHPCDITASFLEIYNERVHDLLVGEKVLSTCHSLPRQRGNARKDLRVREHPVRGPYVQNLRRVAIHDSCALLQLVEEGVRRRRTAATRRNCSSSRSHALLELTTKTATLHLADLAGSEKAGWESYSGGRQKEGANINKSLVALSNVISALVAGGPRGRFVPYRDSALTWLLKDCFTGGASTYVIATVSPSSTCYNESASTLRWAARARQLLIPRPSNNTAVNNSRIALQKQFNQLIAELGRNFIRYVPETGKIRYEEDHWALQKKKLEDLNSSNTKVSKIGNIWNMTSQKSEILNSSESGLNNSTHFYKKTENAENESDIAVAVSKEVDKMFGSVLERTSSGTDLKMATVPFKNKQRQYRSQEVLPDGKLIQSTESLNTGEDELSPKTCQNIPIVYDKNQRAEIIASVTERLYSKLKRKEETAEEKIQTVVDKKIMEPVSELRICTNARQRLIEISQKAFRNKRRIGIPAYTQTRSRAIRVKDQSIDVQRDLLSYVRNEQTIPSHRLFRDVSTETIPMTPRCKDTGVGPNYGSLQLHDRSTITDTKRTILKSSSLMTDNLLISNSFTQTSVLPPPRRKKRTASKTDIKNNEQSVPIIRINISQPMILDTETQSSDDNIVNTECQFNLFKDCEENKAETITPDLLTNHNLLEVDNDNFENRKEDTCNRIIKEAERRNIEILENKNTNDEFCDRDDSNSLRTTIHLATESNQKDLTLGQNKDVDPHNNILSLRKDKQGHKKIVMFKESSVIGSKTSNDNKVNKVIEEVFNPVLNSKSTNERSDVRDLSDSTDSSMGSSDYFIWSKNIDNGVNKKRVPWKTNSSFYNNRYKYTNSNNRICKEFLSLDGYSTEINNSDPCSFNNDTSSDNIDSEVNCININGRRSEFLEDMYTKEIFSNLEGNILNSCNKLEKSVDHYEKVLSKHEKFLENCRARTPSQYLHHLVKLRRETIETESTEKI